MVPYGVRLYTPKKKDRLVVLNTLWDESVPKKSMIPVRNPSGEYWWMVLTVGLPAFLGLVLGALYLAGMILFG